MLVQGGGMVGAIIKLSTPEVIEHNRVVAGGKGGKGSRHLD
jgi:hypothetical protein